MSLAYSNIFKNILIVTIIALLVISISFTYTNVHASNIHSTHNALPYYNDRVKFLLYYTQLIEDYNNINSFYNFLIKNEIEPPLSIYEILVTVNDIINSIRLQINTTTYDQLTNLSEVGLELLASANESLNKYMKTTYPMGRIYYYYQSLYNRLYSSNQFSIFKYISFIWVYTSKY